MYPFSKSKVLSIFQQCENAFIQGIQHTGKVLRNALSICMAVHLQLTRYSLPCAVHARPHAGHFRIRSYSLSAKKCGTGTFLLAHRILRHLIPHPHQSSSMDEPERETGGPAHRNRSSSRWTGRAKGPAATCSVLLCCLFYQCLIADAYSVEMFPTLRLHQ